MFILIVALAISLSGSSYAQGVPPSDVLYFKISVSYESFLDHKVTKYKGFMKETIDPVTHSFYHQSDMVNEDGTGPVIRSQDKFVQSAGKWEQSYTALNGKILTSPAFVKIIGPKEMSFSATKENAVPGLFEKGSGHFSQTKIEAQSDVTNKQGSAIGKGKLEGSAITPSDYAAGLQSLSKAKSPVSKTPKK